MSRTVVRNYTCPNCNKEFELEQYESFTSKGELSNVIDALSEKFITVKCPHCGMAAYSPHSFMYNDVKNNFMVCHATSLNDAHEFILAFDDFNKDFPVLAQQSIRRIVINSPYVFKEKIGILSKGLNDKVVEIYKTTLLHNLGYSPDEAHATVQFSTDFSQMRIAVEFKDGRDDEYFNFVMDMYHKIEKMLEDCPIIDRYEDYIVDEDFIYLTEPEQDDEPKHVDLFREKKRVVLVGIPALEKELYYFCDIEERKGDQIFVPYRGKEYEGYVISQEYLSEKKLGFSFDKLKRPTKIRFNADVMPKIYVETLLPHVIDGAGCFVYDVDVDDEIFDQYIENEIVYNDDVFVGTLAKKTGFEYQFDNTRFIIISNHPDDFQSWYDDSNIGIFNEGYFKVLHKYTMEGKKVVILLHLNTDEWIQFGVLHGNINYPDGTSLLDELINNLKHNTLDYDEENIKIGLKSENACAVGYKNGKINIVKSYAVLD